MTSTPIDFGTVITIREGWRLVCTCPCAPEQYDLLDHKGEKKAYFRLRFGHFAVWCPDVFENLVFEQVWYNDEFKGSFDSDEERKQLLEEAVTNVEHWWREHG